MGIEKYSFNRIKSRLELQPRKNYSGERLLVFYYFVGWPYTSCNKSDLSGNLIFRNSLLQISMLWARLLKTFAKSTKH